MVRSLYITTKFALLRPAFSRVPAFGKIAYFNNDEEEKNCIQTSTFQNRITRDGCNPYRLFLPSQLAPLVIYCKPVEVPTSPSPLEKAPRGGQQQGVKRSSASSPSTAPKAPCKKRLGETSLQKSGLVIPVTLSQQTRKDFGLPANREQSEDEEVTVVDVSNRTLEENGGPETREEDSRTDQLGQGVILTTPSHEDGGPQSN